MAPLSFSPFILLPSFTIFAGWEQNKEASDEEEVYQTERLQLSPEQDEVPGSFGRLGEKLNQVKQFYKTTESELLERGDFLNKQLEILLYLKQILNDRRRKPNAGIRNPMFLVSLHSIVNFGQLSEIRGIGISVQKDDSLDSNDTAIDISQTDDATAALERSGVSFNDSGTTMRIARTPMHKISALISIIREDIKNNPKKEGSREIINKKIQCAEKMIRRAFVELYQGLGLLKTNSSLYMVAFTKILKKFDKVKVSNQQASANYLNAVKKSHFISYDKVVRLMDEVESIFTKHFANNDRKKAMKFLRPHTQKESHMITLFVGLFTGCFVSQSSVYTILAYLSGIFSSNSEVAYMDTVFPIFSVFALLSLHMFMYGCNLFLWKSTRINYNFIFEFSPNTALKYRDAFLICTTLMTSVVGAMVIHLFLRVSEFLPSHVDVIPGILLLVVIALIICPFDILYRPTRRCFLRIMGNIICSPFYKVLFVDSFMADQLTSQIPLLRHLESTACYFISQKFNTHQDETCKSGRPYRELVYVISFLPYYWRAMQCARRWFDECDINQLANMGKYVSAIVAAGARLTYAREPNHLWFVVVLVTSVVATIYQLYWDLVMDWGFLNPKSKNPWLRDDLILKKKSIYYVSIALNVVLRVVWVETMMRFQFNRIEFGLMEFFLATLEVIRRGHWNFYRLENEHLNNVCRFKAVETVPLMIELVCVHVLKEER